MFLFLMDSPAVKMSLSETYLNNVSLLSLFKQNNLIHVIKVQIHFN